MKNILLRLGRVFLLLLILGGGGLYSYLYFAQNSLLFFPSQKSFTNCSFDKSLEVEVYNQNNLRYYHFKVEKPKGQLIHFHGNGGRACDWAVDANYYTGIGIEPVFVEYPGYAIGDTGEDKAPSVRKIKENVDHLASHIKHNGWKNLFIHGISLGTGPATYLATIIETKALILDHPYSRLSYLASYHYPLPGIEFILKDDFEADLWAEKIQAPVMINQGDKDQVIPFSIVTMQMDNFTGWKKLKLYKGYGHNNLTMHENYWGHIQEFILKYGLKKSDD